MRVLVVSIPAIGHLYPLVPLAWAFRAAGHDVLLATAEHVEHAERTGLRVADIAPGYDTPTVMGRALAENPDLARMFRSGPMRAELTDWAPQFAAVNRPLLPGVLELADSWRPDLVVYDHAATCGLIAADRLGVPAVQQVLGVFSTGSLHVATTELLARTCPELGLRTPADPAVVLEYMPPSMLTRAPEGWFSRFVPYTGGGRSAPVPAHHEGRPRIAVTLGTIAPQRQGLGQLEPLIAAAAEIDVELVLALGDVDPGPLGVLPPNVRSVGWEPLDALLDTCAAVVHHGGASTMMTAISHGLPQLVVLSPHDPIRPLMGEAVSSRGVGVVASPDEVTAKTIHRLLTDEALHEATAEVDAENRALPSPAATAARIRDTIGHLTPAR
ncbi:nucleotide disphospho-sugar-binding domain-containing protein [Umezawaea sp. NPDC059074]|uniref:nucleotide disphospho-sugar-binding domain-containing protein n=1 Tax=Umezawaea sp. NPDC059074 TaxID=3346716 RepID=UPI0036AC9A71